MKIISHHYVCLGALALLLSTGPAQAGHIAIEPGAGDPVVAILNGDSMMFADAYRSMIMDEAPDLPTYGKGMRSIRLNAHTPTVARMEYTYTKDGVSRTRIYHARSGPAMRVNIDRATYKANADGTSSESSLGESSGAGYDITDADIEKDFAERIYYPADTSLDVRVRNLPAEGSAVQPLGENAFIHKADAELKIFRQIELDIANGQVARGGKLLGYVSKTVCDSCTPASELFADHFDIDGTIYQLIEPDPTAPVPRDPLLRDSHASSRQLKALRKNYAETHLKRDGVTRPGETSWTGTEAVERLEAEEAGVTLAGACGD